MGSLRMRPRLAVCTLAAALLAGWPGAAPAVTGDGNDERVINHDNLRAAGSQRGSVLTVALEARTGLWSGNGPTGMHMRVAAFGEAGKPLQNPGPLLRVQQGTEVRATMRNTLAKPLTVFGLGETRGVKDSVVIAPGATHEFRFVANQPGTFFYVGKTTPAPIPGRGDEDSQLNGALIVDPIGVSPPRNERIMLISWWFRRDSTQRSGLHPQSLLAINGRQWPHTERLEVNQGEPQHFRVINLVGVPHPMHLHGFYFRLDATGTPAAEEPMAEGKGRLSVTEVVLPLRTIRLTWTPERPGNWIFHCHFASHIAPLDLGAVSEPSFAFAGRGAHDGHSMAGLVVGITVKPRGASAAAPTRPARELGLTIRSKPRVHGDQPGYAYVLTGSEAHRDPEALPVPGPLLLLERDQPVAITITNDSHEPAAVHWHGIELESFPDGVPNWSGEGRNTLPAVAPGSSLTVRFTPPRAGTFMYHSHFNEFQQLASGLVAPLVVLEPGQRFDPDTDHVLLFSDDGPFTNVIDGPFSGTLLNGKKQPEQLVLKAGVPNRLRLINITTDWDVKLKVLDAEEPVAWRPLAKDGADLDGTRAPEPAELLFFAGEIYDFEIPARPAGSLKLVFQQLPPFLERTPVEVPVIIR